MGTVAGQVSSGDPGALAQHLTSGAKAVVDAALSPATHLAYKAAWDKFDRFCKEQGIQLLLPVSKQLLVNYLTFLFEKGLAASTLLSHTSAIAYFHKVADLPDPTGSFLVKKFLKGAQKLRQSSDTRLPITCEILHKLLLAVKSVFSSHREQSLWTALFLVCFQGFLRVGEVCLQSRAPPSQLIQREDAVFCKQKDGRIALQLTIRHFKHMAEGCPAVLVFQASNAQQFCLVSALQKYLASVPSTSGPLFQWLDGSPVSYSFAAAKLSQLVSFIGLDARNYKPHSFRIGAATSAFLAGHSEEEIQRMGRWKSSAVKGYIRLPKFFA